MTRFHHQLLDIRFSDFLARHVFTAKLRIVILISFWFFAVFWAPSLLKVYPPIMFYFSLLFGLTTLSYILAFRGEWKIFFFVLELFADVAGITLVVYLMGGPASYFFFLYILYTVAAGLFYNWRVAAICSVVSLSFFVALNFLLSIGWIDPFAQAKEITSILWRRRVAPKRPSSFFQPGNFDLWNSPGEPFYPYSREGAGGKKFGEGQPRQIGFFGGDEPRTSNTAERNYRIFRAHGSG